MYKTVSFSHNEHAIAKDQNEKKNETVQLHEQKAQDHNLLY